MYLFFRKACYGLMLFSHCGETFASLPFLKLHILGEDATKCFRNEFEDMTCVSSFFFLYFDNICFWQSRGAAVWMSEMCTSHWFNAAP